MKIMYLDVDGVLLDWTVGFREWLICAKNIRTNGDRPADWGMADWIIGPHDIGNLITEFNESPEFKFLKPIEGAIFFLKLLKVKGYEINAVTACGDSEVTIAMRNECLERNFPKIFDSITCMKIGQSKSQYYKDRESGIVIDDHVTNVNDAVAAGHTGILFRTPENLYSVPSDGALIADSFFDIVSIIG